jgi:transcriptional regulator with XRE-family HTH domain
VGLGPSQAALRKTVADNVRRLRKAQGLSQEAFADHCGLHRTYVGAIERAERNVSLDNIAKLAQALDTEPWRLLRGGG